MSRKLWLAATLLLATAGVSAGNIKGSVKDAKTGEEIIGAYVVIQEEPSNGTVTGMDGSFSLSTNLENYTLVCKYMGYSDRELSVYPGMKNVEIALDSDDFMLDDITVTADNTGRRDAGARLIERQSMNVVNVMSARSMELSPDITVANVIQRMSGVTVERNSSGEGQYAILRGMDKRYNYTLINGVKVSSPDNKNRFVPLDMFPSEMLDRLEVTKSLTADMEGDGIGGAVNLVMKDAPSERQFTVNLSSGYNAMYFGRDFESFNYRAIQKQSPYEAKGMQSSKVTMDDFTMDNLHMNSGAALPDLIAGFSYGDRFFKNKLGIMAAASFLNTYRGKESQLIYQPGTTHNGIEYRNYSAQQTKIGAHLKLDYHINPNHKLMWYNGYMDMREAEVRNKKDDKEGAVRMKWNRQYIFNSTLKGEHYFLHDRALKLEWSAVASTAYNETPDNAEIYLLGNHLSNTNSANRRWEHNSDRDLAGYLDLTYTLKVYDGSRFDFSAGGMFRDKKRDSFFNEYWFQSATASSYTPQVYGEDWTNFDQLLFDVQSRAINSPLNYDASEQIGAGYGMVKYTRPKWEFIAGVRVEHTDQGYVLKFPGNNEDPVGHQVYTDVLPSFHAKYTVHKNANLRFSYARAINRPSFFEIVPYHIVNEDYPEEGNPDLKHTVADNIDFRYEFFPATSEQFMVGFFYKRLIDPIEYGLVQRGQDLTYMPMNFGNANNLGVEIDIQKYFSWFGIKANYTYTHSEITTSKLYMDGNETKETTQTRPLYGQAAHVANLSLLFKSTKYGWEGQIAGSYTGKRLSEISQWIDDDIWEEGYFQLDLSVEKSFKFGLSIFAKASNLLDMPLLRFIQNGPMSEDVQSERTKDGCVIERREWHGQSIMVGLRYNL